MKYERETSEKEGRRGKGKEMRKRKGDEEKEGR